MLMGTSIFSGSRRLASASEDHDATTTQKTVMNHILQILRVPEGSQVPLKSRKTKKKEKHARRVANTDAVSSTFVPLYDDKTDANPSKQHERELARAGWSEEKWDNNWGKDSQSHVCLVSALGILNLF